MFVSQGYAVVQQNGTTSVLMQTPVCGRHLRDCNVRLSLIFHGGSATEECRETVVVSHDECIVKRAMRATHRPVVPEDQLA